MLDPELVKKGNGVYRRDGYILGVSISNGEFSEYYNLGHHDCKLSEKSHNIKYLTEVLGNDCPKLGTNFKYDMDWLENWQGIKVNGYLNDVQTAEPLIDEYARSYSLNSLDVKYLGETKQNNRLLEFCAKNGLKTTLINDL